MAFSNNGRRIETGLFGYERLSGTAVILQTEFTPMRYVQTMMTQTSQTALSNRQAKLEERWLLMCRYRINSDEMNLTHEFLSIMLGVHRRGVTIGSALLLSLCDWTRC
ncbi:hypothetical protein [uncultured Sulfitobacter sp.]|uniref:hypothetical protein n=1 Tax=uncultured Sulfitobacter sp. TaxID=191468 RepID=UPI00263210CC|nr:hypothetical protein [uncultured Sulfitobacter sp.]